MGKTHNIDIPTDKYVTGVIRHTTNMLWLKGRDGLWKKYDAVPDGTVIGTDFMLCHPELANPPREPAATELGRQSQEVRKLELQVWKLNPEKVSDQDVINLNRWATAVQEPGSEWHNAVYRHVPAAVITGKGGRTMTDNKDAAGALAEGATGSFFETFLGKIVDSGAKAVPAVMSQRAINAGTTYLAKELRKNEMEAAAAFLQSPGGQAIAGVLLPALVCAGASKFPGQPKAQLLANVMQAGLDAGAVRALDSIAERVLMPVMMVMLQAAGLAGELPAGFDATVETEAAKD